MIVFDKIIVMYIIVLGMIVNICFVSLFL